jgi:uncharacterized UPF0160 family protein
LSLLFNYKIHGANPLAADGSVIRNVGGDINLGHRTFDPEKVMFLDGYKEYSRYYSLAMIYEPVNQYFITLKLNYINETLQTFNNETLDILFVLSIKI